MATWDDDIGAFIDWLNERAANYEQQLARTHINQARRDRLKTEAAELEAVREGFARIVLQRQGWDMPPGGKSLRLTGINQP